VAATVTFDAGAQANGHIFPTTSVPAGSYLGTFSTNLNGVFLIYTDAYGNVQKTTLATTTSGNNWSCSAFSLPLNNWTYLLCVRVYDSADQSTNYADRSLGCGTPHN
jgi:hypothetical protein